MITAALLLSGFSIFSALVLVLSHFRSIHYPEQSQSSYMGMALVLILAGLQFIHFDYLQSDSAFVFSNIYQVLLFSVAPAFYLFSKPLLKGRQQTLFKPLTFIHLIPIVLAPWLDSSLTLPLSFAIGAGYLLWLSRSLYALRLQRSRFNLEISILGVAFFIGVVVLVMGLSLPGLSEKLFFSLYASAIGGAFVFVNLAINLSPSLPVKLTEAACETYVTSMLSNVDCDTALGKLKALMSDEKVYENMQLDLHTLSQKISLSSHQLSELINTRLGKGFSRYIREQRVEAAKAMLLKEPSTSVLAVGLSVGFTSQSNFYNAFREITDMTPGKYRKVNSTIVK